ncbi:MAG: hypothetical protein HC804_04165 [Anaerolineae bacterium]|nr:hypothetical protein [Anaerolineae bacterium]
MPFAILLALASLEYVQMTGHLGWRVLPWLFLPLVIAQWVIAEWGQPQWVGPSIFISMLIMLTAVLFSYERHSSQTTAVDWMAYMGWLSADGMVG